MPRNYSVDVNDTFYATETSVAWTTSITQVSQLATSRTFPKHQQLLVDLSPFTVPITTSITFFDDAIPNLSFFTTWGNGCVSNNNGPGKYGMCFTTGAWRMPLRLIPFAAAGAWRYSCAAFRTDWIESELVHVSRVVFEHLPATAQCSAALLFCVVTNLPKSAHLL